MIVPENIKSEILKDHEIEVAIAKAQHTSDIFHANQRLREEIEEKLDLGVRMVDITIELKNRLWLMKKNKVDMENPEYIALQETIYVHQEFDAEEFYKTNGWKKKFSGEWVKKDKE